ncbi:MAG: DNA recombination protein RmuC [Cyclobacteriaceae bacterium]|tara:strand:+ start:1690 stop:2811 length:1122 start_codon:yes stop_codon:yes gene_type:complete
METLLIVLIILVIGGIAYIVHLLSQKRNDQQSLQALMQQFDLNIQSKFSEGLNGLNTSLQQVDANLKLKVAEGINGLNTNLQNGLEKGADALKSTQGESLNTTQTLMQKILQQVDKRMDEMSQSFGQISKANDFMRMLFNPASRGHIGEVQLESLLTEILAPTQYEKNFKPFPNQEIRVEFAVKMPTDLGTVMYLPIDSKFPKEEFEKLNQAETKEDQDKSKKALIAKIKEFGRQISKYINAPVTTDMAMMYLPDGIYEWVTSQPELVEHLRKQHKVVVAGPATLWTMISFVSHFFRVIAINDQSKEVMELLGKFKKQVKMTTEVIDKAINHNRLVGEKLDDLRGTRYNQMMRELKDVEESSAVDDSDSSKAA